MEVVAMDMMAVVVAWRTIEAGPWDPVAGLYPAKAVPDRAADGANVLDEVGSAGLAKAGASRQRQGLCTAGNKRRCGHKRQGGCGSNKQTTHSFPPREHDALIKSVHEVLAVFIEIAMK
jgi:hypothetical protein